VPQDQDVVEERERHGPDGGRGTLRRVLVLLALAVAGVVTGRVIVLVLQDPAPAPAASPAASPAAMPSKRTRPSPTPGGAPGEDPVRRAAEVLHAWDAERSAAYASGDPAALRRLYLPRSRAAARDVRTLRAYAARGLAVRGLQTQVLSLQVLAAGRDRLMLEVTDRLVGGRAIAHKAGTEAPWGAGLALPRDGPTTRVLVLRTWEGEWRMGTVEPA
jgi:hypothetical protein